MTYTEIVCTVNIAVSRPFSCRHGSHSAVFNSGKIVETVGKL